MAATTVTPEQQSDQLTGAGTPPGIERAPGRWIEHWDPEDPAFWEGERPQRRASQPGLLDPGRAPRASRCG